MPARAGCRAVADPVASSIVALEIARAPLAASTAQGFAAIATEPRDLRAALFENGVTTYLMRDAETGAILRDDDTNQPLYDEVV